jgi:hypothetical protein
MRSLIIFLFTKYFIVSVFRLVRIRWRTLECMGETRNAYKILVEKSEGDQVEDLGVDGTITLK